MLLRHRNVKFSVFDPEKSKWITKEDMSVVIAEDYIYAVKAEPFYNAVVKRFESCNNVKNTDDRAEKHEKFSEYFNKMLDEHIISETLQGEIYSKTILWKIEYEENAFHNMGGDIE